jgi:hypothetical protein
MTHDEENAVIAAAKSILSERRRAADLENEAQQAEAATGSIRFNPREKLLIAHLRRLDELTEQRIAHLEMDYGRLRKTLHVRVLELEAENRALCRRVLQLEREQKRG